MDERLKKIAGRVAGFWKSLGKKKRIWIIGGFSAIVVALIVTLAIVNNVQYTQLYSGLSDSESGEIITQLKSMGVPYKVSGNSIYVDKKEADTTRMQLAESGYPQTDLTYSTYLSGNSWAMTDSDKQRLALYQVQDRLQDTIQTIPGVKSAEVTIGQSDNNDYVLSSDDVPVTASVKLNLSPGTDLTSKQVKGIVLLVSHSYPDLSQDNVTVLDSDGTPLNDDSSDDSSDTAQQLKLQNQVENLVQSKELSVLTPIYGSGNVQVAAGATMDFSQSTTSSVTYSGTNSGTGVVSSENKSDVYDNGTSAAGGTVGLNNGQPTYPTSSGSSATGPVQQSNDQVNYLVNSVNSQIKSQGGTVKTLTVSVLLNNRNANAATANAQSVQQAVAYAVGIKPQNVSVQFMPFASSAGQKTAATTPSPQLLMIGGGAVALLLAVIILLLVLSARRRKKEKAAALAAEMEEEAQEALPGTVTPVLPQKTLEETIAETPENSVKKQIEDFANQKPELVAQLLKNWLKD